MSPALQILAQYYHHEISGWDILSWVAELDSNNVGDPDAYKELLCLDETQAEGYHPTIINLILRLIPKAENKSLGELLIDEAIVRLEKQQLTSRQFIEVFSEIYHNEIDTLPEKIVVSDWIHEFYNQNNGYGFVDLSNAPRTQLLGTISKLINPSA